MRGTREATGQDDGDGPPRAISFRARFAVPCTVRLAERDASFSVAEDLVAEPGEAGLALSSLVPIAATCLCGGAPVSAHVAGRRHGSVVGRQLRARQEPVGVPIGPVGLRDEPQRRVEGALAPAAGKSVDLRDERIGRAVRLREERLRGGALRRRDEETRHVVRQPV